MGNFLGGGGATDMDEAVLAGGEGGLSGVITVSSFGVSKGWFSEESGVGIGGGRGGEGGRGLVVGGVGGVGLLGTVFWPPITFGWPIVGT